MIFHTSELNSQEVYHLLIGGVTPRPIAWISTRSQDGVDNLAPYSFFGVASCNPPVLFYSQVTPKDGADKDTLQNLLDTRECVINIVCSPLLEQMNLTCTNLPCDQSEFDFAQVKRRLSHCVRPSSVAESQVTYECSLRDVIRVSDLPSGGTIALLDVKFIYVHDDLWTGTGINQSLIDTVGKMGGDLYSFTRERIELARP